MNELVKITKATINDEEINAVDGRELWKALKSRQQFTDWIKDRLADFVEGQDFTFHKIMNGKNPGRFAKTEYIISLDAAKHIAMLERNEQGRKVRQYFIEAEKALRKQAALPSADVLMATLYTEMERRVKAEAERDEYKRNLARIAAISNLEFGSISEETGLARDIVVGAYVKSSKKKHEPQYTRYVQLILPMRELIGECF